MTNLTLTFPTMPDGADKSIITPSRDFKRSIYKVIAAISTFVLVYIISLAFAVAIAVAMGLLGVFLISEVHQLLVLVFSLGLILAGVMLCFFLVKFIFAKSRPIIPGYEVSRDEQPELFAFIDQVTAEVGTRRPRHVYLIPEVNASASFKTTFWSMFFPIRKDLNIGLGLVNGINQSEFKAVLAHEFGHFSQKSMRFGSYVNNLNRALYNLLYENDGYYSAINSVARTHSVIRVCFMLIVYIIQGIQAILKKVYIFINKSYMQLSREMEFHADTIAAYTSGSNNVISSLRRIEAADQCYNQAFALLNKNFTDGNGRRICTSYN